MSSIAGTLLVTPDHLVVLQRRTHDAPTSPDKLSLFGGHMENDEEPLAAAKRELSEETSLETDSLPLELIAVFEIEQKNFFTFATTVTNSDFEVYEGVGAESYEIGKVLSRDDLTYSARYTIEKYLERKTKWLLE